MAITADEYLHQLQALLPNGPAWPRDLDTELARLLAAFAEEFSRIDAQVEKLTIEADPRATSDMLPDWERVAGLPDACVGEPASISERRALLVSKLSNVGGQSRQFFIDVAAQLGYEVTITEFRPYRVNSHVNDAVIGEAWLFVWQVNAAQNMVRRFAVTSQVSDPLAGWGNEILECAISRLKPAHTHVKFAYT